MGAGLKGNPAEKAIEPRDRTMTRTGARSRDMIVHRSPSMPVETSTMRRFLADALTTLTIALLMGLAWVL